MSRGVFSSRFVWIGVAVALGWVSPAIAEAPRVLQAKRIFERLAGVPPSTVVVPPLVRSQAQELRELALQGETLDVDAVANLAMQDRHFYEITVLRLATPWSNTDGSANDSLHLNDSSALAIGMVRDNLPFNEYLFGDHYYRAHESITSGVYPSTDPNKVSKFTRGGVHPEHYQDLQRKGFDLTSPNVLKRFSQKGTIFYTPPNCNGDDPLDPNVNFNDCTEPNIGVRTPFISAQGSANPDIGGVLTTRAFGRAAYENGTNRRAVNLLVRNHLCGDIHALKDVVLPDDHVRRDVDRSPGGDHSNYQSNCVGCHAPMDALAGAFALFDFEADHIIYRPGVQLYSNDATSNIESTIRPKNNKNNTVFPLGNVVTDTSWVNHLWRSESYDLGWRNSAGASYKSGNGVHSLGKAIAATRRFSECKMQQVYEKVCHLSPATLSIAALQSAVNLFETGNYNLKILFREAVKQCL